MVRRILEAKSGQVHEVQDDVAAAEGQLSYNTGGLSYTAAIGRVDAAIAQIQSDSQTAKVTSINSPNEVVVQLFSQAAGDASEEGQEIDADTDITSVPIALDSYRL